MAPAMDAVIAFVCPGCVRRSTHRYLAPTLRCACGWEGKRPGALGRRYTIGTEPTDWTVLARGGPPFNVGGPSGNVLIERDDGHRVVRPFRGLRRVVA